MADSLTLRVITPERVLLDTSATSVQFPGLDGSVGVLKGHAHMVAALDAGLLEWAVDGKVAGDMFVSGGFAEVRDNTVRIVTEAGELATSIDVDRATKAAERAKDRLKVRKIEGAEFDSLRAESALRRAWLRRSVATRAKR